MSIWPWPGRRSPRALPQPAVLSGTANRSTRRLRSPISPLRWAGFQPHTGSGFGRFAVKAKTSVSGGTIALSTVNVELDGNVAEGVLTFSTDGRRTVQGT